MNLRTFFIVFSFTATAFQPSLTSNVTQLPSRRTARVQQFWLEKNSTDPESRQWRYLNSTDLSPPSLKNSTSSRQYTRIPQVNFYQSIPNALGVIGQGIIWLREISAALGTPIPIWIFTIPFFILGAGLMFMPDLTQLHLPLFYPNGAGDADPFAAFPPLPDLEDLNSLNIMKQVATQLIPPKFLIERFG